MSKSIIRHLPTETDIAAWVNELIEPARADIESKRFMQILFAVANPDDNEQWNLARAAARAAYLLTMDFEENFNNFAELPERLAGLGGVEITEISKEQ